MFNQKPAWYMAVGMAAYNLYFLTELHSRATFHLLGVRVAGVVNKLLAPYSVNMAYFNMLLHVNNQRIRRA